MTLAGINVILMYLKIMSITFTLYNGQRWMEIDGEAERRIGRNERRTDDRAILN